ncbi:MAG: DUF5658 family protein [Planctomycetaceae bacterium]
MIAISARLPLLRIGCHAALPLVLCFSTVNSGLRAQEHLSAATPDEAATELFFGTVETGRVFLEGNYVEAPYRVSATANSVSINGLAFPWEWSTALEEYDDAVDPMGEIDGLYGRSRRGNQRRGGRERRPFTVRVARDLLSRLEVDAVVVAFSESPWREFSAASTVVSLYEALLASPPSEKQVQAVLDSMSFPAEADVYRNWLLTFNGSPSLQAVMQTRIDEVLAVEEASLAHTRALVRLDQFSYPLTLAGMLLGVIAMGHMLRWTGRSMVTDQGDQCSPESVRCAEVALLLMLGMSVVDLVWTILAGQAGLMKELNPVAAGFIDSPFKLAAFKVSATLLGCGILYAIRSRKNGQAAVWWMCLVCVLVTFRWVMFDSMTA